MSYVVLGGDHLSLKSLLLLGQLREPRNSHGFERIQRFKYEINVVVSDHRHVTAFPSTVPDVPGTVCIVLTCVSASCQVPPCMYPVAQHPASYPCGGGSEHPQGREGIRGIQTALV